MKFWQSFSKKSALRQLLFVLFLFALLIPTAIWDSGTQVKVTFDSTKAYVKSDRYNMSVGYDLIEAVELAELGDPGEKLKDGFDNDIVRTGCWKNDIWGEYYVCADPDTGNCVVLHLNDGRTFVISSKNDKRTQEVYETFLTHLNKAE